MGRDRTDDHYGLLGVDPAATRAEIRRAWRLLALRWHPDRAGPEATSTFQQIHAAYVVLADPDARAAYDRSRGAIERASRRRAPRTMLARLCGPMNALLACGIASQIDDELIELHLDEEEAADGGIVAISMYAPAETDGVRYQALYSAWLTVPPAATDGTVIVPSVQLRGMLHPLRFRLRVR